MHDHARRSRPEDTPLLTGFKTMDMDQRWLNRSPDIMLDTFHWFRGEGFGLIVEDLLRLSTETGVIAEGFRLLPHLIEPLLAEPSHAVWLLPTPSFRRAAFDSRGTTWDIPTKTRDPQRALHNLLERDRMFTDRLLEDTQRLGLLSIRIDTGTLEDALADQVMGAFGLASVAPTHF